MNEQKETAPVLQHQDGKVETEPASQAGPHLHQQFITDASSRQAVHIADFLLHGEERAIPMRHLRELLHLPNRTIRLMIRQERLGGVPICEDSKNGYFMPSSADERDLCPKRLRHRAAQIVKVADAIAAADIKGAEDIGR